MKIIPEVTYVYAAAHDIVSGAAPSSKWYRPGDLVVVDIQGGTHVDIRLTLVEEKQGTFQGVVVASADERFKADDPVSFNYHG